MFSRVFGRLLNGNTHTKGGVKPSLRGSVTPPPLKASNSKWSKQPSVPRQSEPSPELDCLILKKHWPWTADMTGARSHFGGLPMLPSHIAWPRCDLTYGVKGNYPMHFLAQIDCAELPEFNGRAFFPPDGLLFFFMLMDDSFGGMSEGQPSTTSVIYVPAREITGRRREPPADIHQSHAGHESTNVPEAEDLERNDHLGGFVPISFVPAPSSRDPMSQRRTIPTAEEQDINSRILDAIYNKALGAPKYDHWTRNFSDAYNVETVLQVREVIYSMWLKSKRYRLRDKVTFKELMTNDDFQIFADLILSEISDYPPEAAAPLEVREVVSEIWAKCSSSDEDSFWCAARLARRFPIETLPFTDNTLDRLADFAKGRQDNQCLLLGFPSEAQSEGPSYALQQGKYFGLYDNSVTEDDIVLLLQLDTCYGGANWMMCDCGKLYFYIHRDDLAAGRFDRAVMTAAGG